MVAVLRIGLGRAGIARVQALERSQRCAHQIGDRAVLLGDRLFQTDALVIAAFRHHGGARRGERHRGRPLFEIAAEFHVEAIREPQLAQQPGHRLTVPPF